MKERIRTKSESETLKVARNFTEEILEISEPCKVVFLKGELGAGKTIFAKGVATALGIKKVIESPTFVFLREYKEGEIPLYHFDLYRINKPEELDELGFFEYLSKKGVILVEWAEKAEKYAIPLVTVSIKKTGKSEREIEIEYGEDFNNK